MRAGYLKSLAARLLGGSALVATALTWPGAPAHAVCDPAAADNVNAICSDVTINQNDPNGYGTGNENNVTVNVLTGASVTGTNIGIFLNNNITIVNDGTITGQTFAGIDATDLILTNRGAITGVTNGVIATNLVDLTNSGTITGGEEGVFATNITSLTNSGAITGGTDGVFTLFDINSLTNSGTITGQGNDGVLTTGNITSLINSGTITGAEDGVEAITVTSLINSGTIAGGDDGVFTDDDITSLINSGTITGGDEGVQADAELTSLTNSGTITGGDDGVRANTIGSLTNSGTITGGDDGVGANVGITSLTNSGTITGGIDGIFVTGVITNLTNSGTITGGDDGVSADGGIVTLTNSGTITGSDNGVVTDGDLTNLTNSGAITGGDVGVFVDNDLTNLTNSGTITGGVDGVVANVITTLTNSGLITGGNFAIREAAAGDTLVDNFGTITGSVDLGGGINTFNIQARGLFNAGPIVNLNGPGNLLNNAGTLSPGGLNTPLTTALDGDYHQSATGIFNTDVDFTNGVSDRLDATGTAMLDGLVVANFFNPQAVTPGQQGQVTILTAAGVTDNGIVAQDTAVVDLSLLFIGNDRVDLTAFIDFVPDGLNRNQTAVAETVTAIQLAGGSAAFAPVVGGLLQVPALADLADAYDQLGPEIYLDNGIATLFSSLSFTDDLMSCEVREGGNVFINEGQCIWAKGSGAWFDQDKTGQTIGFERDAIRFAAGGQVALAPDWRVGMAIGYEHSNLDALGGRQNSDADTLHGGAVIKYLFGDGLIAAAISGGQGWYDTTRNLAFGGFAGQTTADHDVRHLTGRLRGAYAFTNGAHYIKPMVDLNISYIDVDGFTERGGNGAALIVSGTDETVFSVSPAVELGWQSALADGTLLRPYLRAGVTVFDDPELVVTSRFAAAPAGSPSFRTVVETDDVVADLAAGLDVLTNDGTVLKVYYSGQFGEDTEQQSVGAKVNLPF